jgi:GNAT superfamily N-acetyltransferase
VLDLLAEAATWMSARGLPNWPVRFSRRLIERNAREGELHVAEIAGDLIGAVTFLWADPGFWGAEGDDRRAGYVHRLVVRRDHAGTGLGADLIDWADERVRAQGRSELRLDVVSQNAPLRRYYERAGFAHVRDLEGETVTRDVRHEWRTSLYRRVCAPQR